MSFVKESLNKYFEGKEAYKIVRDTLAAAVFVYYSAKFANEAQRHGFRKTIMKYLMGVAKAVPLAAAQIDKEKKSALEKLEHSVLGKFEGANERKFLTLPAQGLKQGEIIDMMTRWKSQEEKRWNNGQVSGGIYHGDAKMLKFACEAYSCFALTNPLHPDVFPYIRKMESEVISMGVGLFNGNERCCGAMTTGGTESILVAMLAYRNRGRAQGILEAEVVAPDTAHAAFDKAADYFGIKLIKVRVDPVSLKVDMKEMRAAITKNTVALVGSAPNFPHGIIDPIKELSDLAVEHKIGLHVDCCLGSFLIPMLDKLGYKIPPFDFRLPGVSSISADTHKYGFAPKGSSLIMFNSTELRQYMFFVAPEWPGGVYCSPTMTGSRAGGLVAATWAVMTHLGEEGYLDCARGIMKAAKTIDAGVRRIEGLMVMGEPEVSVIAFTNDEKSAVGRKLNVYMVADAMKKRDWNLNALQKPASIHICVTHMHRDKAGKFLDDLRESVKEVLDNPDMYKKGQAAIYGMAETISDAGITSDIAKGYLEVCLKAV